MHLTLLLTVRPKRVNIAVKWWKKHFNKELVMTKEDNENFKNFAKYWICDNDVKVKDRCRISGKYRWSHRDCNINVKLNGKILVVFHNLKSYDSHFIMQKLGRFNLKITVIPYGLEKYMSFTINNKSNFIDSFQFPKSSLNSLVEILSKIRI